MDSMRPISDVAAKLGLESKDFEPYGSWAAKLPLSILQSAPKHAHPSKLILVTAMTPTPAGEGKTTTSIGLAQGFERLGQSVCLALREPSLGPCFGMKGGATGAGQSRLLPAERINLHFTGDFHAITAAHNLLAAMLDNHLHFGNTLCINSRKVFWPRVLDANDRALRSIVVGLGGGQNAVPRESGFVITAASEVMAMLCLAESEDDLRARLSRTIVALAEDGTPVTAAHLKAVGGMMALLADALSPNLVQTIEGTPAIVHGGPFANIAHGCNSVLATRMAMHLAEWTITEAGFGSDLGAEKFFDIVARQAGFDPVAVVLVATIRALKLHGGKRLADLALPDADAVQRGLPNLEKHIENIRHFGKTPVVALNQFGTDAPDEIEVVSQMCAKLGVPFAVSNHYEKGGAGAEELARQVMASAVPTPYQPLYALTDSLPDKLRQVAQKMYGATDIVLSKKAERDIKAIRKLGLENLPICIAKTPNSLSDDASRLGRPEGFELEVQEIELRAGAGFLVALAGDIILMPGLPAKPRAESVQLQDGRVVGLF